MSNRSRAPRVVAALATYCLASGASFLLQLQLCERCGGDNAYLGEVFAGTLFIFLGIVFGLTWLGVSRREGTRGFAAGAIPAVAVGAAVVLLGSTRMLTPPALDVVALLLLVLGIVATVVFARRPSRSVNSDAARM